MFFFWILGDFGEKSKSEKTGKFGHYWAPTPQRREPTPQRKPKARRGIPSLRRGRGAKMAPFRYAEV